MLVPFSMTTRITKVDREIRLYDTMGNSVKTFSENEFPIYRGHVIMAIIFKTDLPSEFEYQIESPIVGRLVPWMSFAEFSETLAQHINWNTKDFPAPILLSIKIPQNFTTEFKFDYMIVEAINFR